MALLGKGSFQVAMVGITSILLSANVVVYGGLTIDYGFFGVSGMGTVFVEVLEDKEKG